MWSSTNCMIIFKKNLNIFICKEIKQQKKKTTKNERNTRRFESIISILKAIFKLTVSRLIEFNCWFTFLKIKYEANIEKSIVNARVYLWKLEGRIDMKWKLQFQAFQIFNSFKSRYVSSNISFVEIVSSYWFIF